MKIISLLIIFIILSFKNGESMDYGIESICGGGYTDKYGITWDWRGINNTCWYEPRICLECKGNGESEPPEGIDFNLLKKYKNLAKIAIDKGYIFKCNSTL